MSTLTSFTFNIAYSVPINKDPSQPTLTVEEFWRGLRRGGEKPQLFAEYVADTEILPNRKSANEFQRKLLMANGAVHTAKGVELLQDVRNADNLLVSDAQKSFACGTRLVSKWPSNGPLWDLVKCTD